MIQLHQFQLDLRSKVIDEIRRGVRRVLIQCATGSGKTVMAADYAKGAQTKGKRLYFIVERFELVAQTAKIFTAMGIDFGIVAAGYTPRQCNILICMIGYMSSRVHLYPDPDTVIVDEAHHAVAATYKRLLASYTNAILLGLTATPERLDGKGLGEQFDALVCGPPVGWLIENDFLSRYRAYSPAQVADFSKIRFQGGDFRKDELQAAMDRPTITGDAIGHYKRLAPGKKMIVFCSGVEHSKHVAQAYLEAGIAAEHVDGVTHKDDRLNSMNRFRSGETLVLTNVDLFAEGVDVPDVTVVQMLRATKSLGRLLQMMGRVLRYAPGKTAIILDHVGNIHRLDGLPDTERKWTLEGKKRKPKGPNEVDLHARQCPKCDAWCDLTDAYCPNCGFVFPVKFREGLEQVEGELVEHVRREKKDFSAMSKAEQLKHAVTLEDFRAIARANGYKRGWATHKFNEKLSIKNYTSNSLED